MSGEYSPKSDKVKKNLLGQFNDSINVQDEPTFAKVFEPSLGMSLK